MTFRRIILTVFVSLALSLLGQLFLWVLPRPLSLLDPVLMLCVSLALSFRFRAALVSGLAAGLLRDLLSPQSFGLQVISLTATIAVISFLVVRFVSHRSAASVAGLNLLALLLNGFLAAFMAASVRSFGGGPFLHPAAPEAGMWLVLALPAQVAVVLALRSLSGWFRSKLTRLVLISPKFRSG